MASGFLFVGSTVEISGLFTVFSFVVCFFVFLEVTCSMVVFTL